MPRALGPIVSVPASAARSPAPAIHKATYRFLARMQKAHLVAVRMMHWPRPRITSALRDDTKLAEGMGSGGEHRHAPMATGSVRRTAEAPTSDARRAFPRAARARY